MNIGMQAGLERLQEGIGELRDAHTGRRSLSDFAQYADNPIGFFRDVLKVRHLWDRQEHMAELVRDFPQVAVAGANGAGKDYAAARIALWWVYARGGTVLLTGPTERQVIEVMMSEIQRAFHPVQDLPGKLYQTALRIEGEPHAGVLAFTSTSSSRLTGFHAPALLIIVTEGQAVEPYVYEALFSNAIGDDSRLLVVGNPLFDSGRFFECFRSPNWTTLRLPATDHPNVTSGENIIPGAITREGVERIAREYGRDSSIYRSRVLAEFPDGALESLVKRQWLEAAAEKFDAGAFDLVGGSGSAKWMSFTAALDPARFGSDRTALALRQGPVLRFLTTWVAKDTMETCGLVLQQLQEQGAPLHDRDLAKYWPKHAATSSLVVDEIGLGAGVLDRLREQGRPAVGFNGSRTPTSYRDAERFLNARAATYWHLREALEAGKVAIPRHNQLWDELCATQWKVSSSGKIQIESKDDLKARLGRSPDLADAVAMCFAGFGQRPSFYQTPVTYG